MMRGASKVAVGLDGEGGRRERDSGQHGLKS